jgi:hypothetical protein
VTGISLPYPNPSNGAPITIKVSTPEQSSVTMEIYTLTFRKIKSQEDTIYGSQNLRWDLKDDAGVQVANGVYYVRIKVAGNKPVTKFDKILILR